MKIKYFNHIDGYDILTQISNPSIDPEATKNAVRQKYSGLELAAFKPSDMQNLFLNNAVYSPPGPGAEVVEDSIATELSSKMSRLGKNRRLSADGTAIIPDYRNVEYWRNEDGYWQKTKVEKLGVDLPKGAVLDEDLTPDQRSEIATQGDKARIAALTAKEREAEKQGALAALADEAARLEKRAQIQGGSFDATAWYREHKGSIETRYMS
jgi:hypothetical protein